MHDDPGEERQPRDDDEVYRLVAEACRDMIIIGRPGVNEWVSPSVTELLGFTPEEFLALDTTSLVHPDDATSVTTARPRIATGHRAEGRLRLRHRDGTWRCLEARVRPLPDGDGSYSGRSISSWRDVTREVEALEQLRASEEQARLLVEHVSDGVALVRDGVFQWVTPNLHEMLGWEPDEWRGRDLVDLMGQAHEPELIQAREQVRAGELPTVRLLIEDASGESHWVEVRTRPYLDEAGHRDGTICVFRIVDVEVAAEAELEHRARHDQLTGLLNRSEVLARLDALGWDARRAGRETAVLFCDLDEFKAVNDTYGHAVGDRVLAVVAERVRRSVRDSDLVARIGGDELLVVLQQLHGVEEALAVADQIRRAVAVAIEVPGGVVTVGVSIGVALVVPGDDADAVISRADAAMYRVKEDGRGAPQQRLFDA